ncbi:MAG: branched-chain amino acid ABC transporter permease [Solirubrobacterales bacterium]|nr:branched-chain amino acid ABC transporter permease [Solirubrobacterales bacterium]
MEAGSAAPASDRTAGERIYEFLGRLTDLPFAIRAGAGLVLMTVILALVESGLPGGIETVALIAIVIAGIAALTLTEGRPALVAGVVVIVLFGILLTYHGLLAVSQTGITGLSNGAIYALGAVGLTLVYGILKLVNFAHGDLLTFGAYMALVASVFWGLPLVVGIVFAMAMTALVGIALEKVMWAPMRRRGAGVLQFVLMSIGLAFVIRYAIQYVYGTELRTLGVDNTSTIDFLGVRIGQTQGIVLLVGLLILVGTGLMLRFSILGKRMRALSDDLELAETSGIDTSRVILWTWVLAGSFAGLAGVFAGATTQLQPELGFEFLLPIFAAVVLGGIGDAFGALAGGLLLGVVVEWSTLLVASGYKSAIGFIVLIIVLIIRPQGIFGRARSI